MIVPDGSLGVKTCNSSGSDSVASNHPLQSSSGWEFRDKSK